MAEKKFVVFMTRTYDLVATVWAETEGDARAIAEESNSVEWEFVNYDDHVEEIREEK